MVVGLGTGGEASMIENIQYSKGVRAYEFIDDPPTRG